MGLCQSKDMAICLIIFNPTKSKNIIKNYFTMKEYLHDLPIFTLELVYEGRKPEILNAFHIYGKSVMFHKKTTVRPITVINNDKSIIGSVPSNPAGKFITRMKLRAEVDSSLDREEYE
jgi:hypothetical protein